ncbi:hypothetical protein FRC10_010106 [Ceratobasidium sp. 414]|nr:hypothetical protein FRC10_010106 [Ceratobasidium sp. 414]
MAYNNLHGNWGYGGPTGWTGEAPNEPLGTSTERSRIERSRDRGGVEGAQNDPWHANHAPQSIGAPQVTFFGAHTQMQPPPASSTFAPGWAPPAHDHAIPHSHPVSPRNHAGPSYAPYPGPMPQTQSYNQSGTPLQPTAPSQPTAPLQQPMAPPQRHDLPHPHAPPVSLSQLAVAPLPNQHRPLPPPHLYSSNAAHQDQTFRGMPDQAHQARPNLSAHQSGSGPPPSHQYINPAGAGSSTQIPQAYLSAHLFTFISPVQRKRPRIEEVEDVDAPRTSARPAHTTGRAQELDNGPRRQDDILREQALQDAIRHLAQPQAVLDTSQADQANAHDRHTQGHQGTVPEDGEADDENEGGMGPSRKSRARRHGRSKRRRVASPAFEGAGTQGHPQGQGDSDDGDGDDDDDTPPRPSPPQPRAIPQWDQTVPCTVPAGRKSRPTVHVKLARHIRSTMLALLKRLTRASPLPPLPPDDVRYPTLNNFSIRFDQSETCFFNQIAANIAALQIRRDYPAKLPEQLVKQIPEMVTSHIRYLCRCYKSELKANGDELRATRLKRASANSRAHTLFASRLKIIDRFPNALGKHRALIVHLGIEGTSSDEEEPGPPDQRSYTVKQRVELSSKVKTLKNKLDLAYNLYYKGPGSKGSQMHRRRPSGEPSSRPFMIEGLPITCISREWLRTLSKPEREFYEFAPHKYDYSFPDNLLKRLESATKIDVDSTGDEDEDEGGDGDEDGDEDTDKNRDEGGGDEDGGAGEERREGYGKNTNTGGNEGREWGGDEAVYEDGGEAGADADMDDVSGREGDGTGRLYEDDIDGGLQNEEGNGGDGLYEDPWYKDEL